MISAIAELLATSVFYIIFEIFICIVCLITGDLILYVFTFGRKKIRLKKWGIHYVDYKPSPLSIFLDLSVWLGFIFWIFILFLIVKIF